MAVCPRIANHTTAGSIAFLFFFHLYIVSAEYLGNCAWGALLPWTRTLLVDADNIEMKRYSFTDSTNMNSQIWPFDWLTIILK